MNKKLSLVTLFLRNTLGTMGRSRHRNRNKKGGGKHENLDQRKERKEQYAAGPKHYKELVKENRLFNKYYQGLGLIPEGEWDEFLKMLNTPLPVTFRINGNRSQAKEMLEVIQGHYLKNLKQVEVDGEVIKPPQQIEWYPDSVAWYMEVSRQSMRKSEMYSKFHKFLVSETESGNISRQEAVSMIPPLLLDVQPHHKVLDMCAAPGSKTAQLIELLHSDENQSVPDGFIIANDADNKRCYMMVHQIKRLQTPCCMIINHDASILPKLRSNTDDKHLQFYQFDRILADVPCSGDGTLRKNPDLWKRWNPTHACSLHGLQKKILKRGVELLAVGGRLVYSTCSFHPVEDEAIVANMLRKAEGCLELIDVRSQLPELKSIPGIRTWKVMSKEGTWYDKFDDLPQLLTNQIRHSMFPPTPQEADTMHLEKCVRILPHHQNTGGFFIAVFQKTKTLPWMKNYSESSCSGDMVKSKDQEVKTETTVVQTETKVVETAGNTTVVKTEDETVVTTEKIEGENVVKTKIIEHETIVQTESVEGGTITKTEAVEDETTVKTETVEKTDGGGDKKRKPDTEGNRPQKKPRLQGYKEDPFLFTKNEDLFWSSIKSFYKLPESFPCDQGMYRSAEGCKRSLYFVSAAIKNIVECNRDRLKFINMGVKLFSRAPSPLVPQCDFRVAQECLSTLHNSFTGRHVDINKEDAFIILTQENPLIETLTPDTKKYLNNLSPGSVVFCYKPKDSESKPQCEIVFCGWRGKVSVRSFVGEHERQHDLMLFGMDLDEIKKNVTALKAERKATNVKYLSTLKGSDDQTEMEEDKTDNNDDKTDNNDDKTDNNDEKTDDNDDKTDNNDDNEENDDKQNNKDTPS